MTNSVYSWPSQGYKISWWERPLLAFKRLQVKLQLGDHGELHMISYKQLFGRIYIYKAMTVDKGVVTMEIGGDA